MTTPITRRDALAIVSAGAVAGFATAASTPAAASVRTGTAAPGFTGTDSRGAQHTLDSHRGKVVVLEWTNHECPYTVKHYVTGNMQALQRQVTADGGIWYTVASSRPGTQGHVNGLRRTS